MFSGKRGPVLLLGEKMGMWSTRWTLRLGAEGVWCVLAHHGHFDDRRRVRTPMARRHQLQCWVQGTQPSLPRQQTFQ